MLMSQRAAISPQPHETHNVVSRIAMMLTYILTYIYIYIYIYLYMYIYIYIYIYMCVCVCVGLYICVYVHSIRTCLANTSIDTDESLNGIEQ